jgi:hypothetical protein
MSCTTLTSITKGCDNNIGGIREIYLWDMEDVVTLTANNSTWTVTSLVVGGTGGSASTIASYDFIRNTSNYTEDGTIDLVNGSSFVTQTINLIFSRREADKSKSIKILGEGQRYLGALVKDSNSNYWVFQDLQISAYGEGSGTAKADGSKYSVTLLGENEYLAYEIGATAAANFISTGNSQ